MYILFQGLGYFKHMMEFAESFAKISQIEVVSCRMDILPIYKKRGYKEVRRFPSEEYIPKNELTRSGLEMIVMQKNVK